MANVLILGAGICGLGTALLLARDGHDVTVLERDAGPVPDTPEAAWDMWERKGVAQFRQPHNFMPGLRRILEAELPELHEALRLAGASRFDFLNPLPPSFADRSPRPIDSQLWTYTARRPTGEWVFAHAAHHEPRVTIRSGLKVTGLVTGPSVAGGIPHVAGVRIEGDQEFRGDLVVDAMGRQSRTPDWLVAAGARRPYEEEEDCGFTYYTRYFRGRQPDRVGPVLTPIGTFSLLTLPGDNGTWSVTIFTASGDQPLKTMRHPEKWMATVRACPLHAQWLDGEPITGVLAMSGTVDRYRRFVVDGTPVATGLVSVADAWACTNPSAGRGLTVGLLHAVVLRDVVRETLDDPLALARAFDDATEAKATPWYRAQIAADRLRFAEIEALREGREPPPPPSELSAHFVSLRRAMTLDPDLYRAFLEYIATITPLQEIVRRPEVAEKMRLVGSAIKSMKQSPPMAGPNREQLLEILS